MDNVWERFENIVTPDEINEAKENTFERATEGTHFVEFLNCEPTETQQGLPIVRFKFRDTANNKLIGHTMFLTNMNYPEQTPKCIAQVMNFAKTILGEEIEFVSMSKLATDLGEITSNNVFEIDVKYKKPDDKYPQIEIIKVITGEDEVF